MKWRFPFRGRHRWFETNIDAYADGALRADEARRLEAHLATCVSCDARLADARELRSLLQRLPEMEAPRSFALTPAMLREPVKEAPRTRPFIGVTRMAQGVAAASMAVFAVLVVVDAGGGGGVVAPASDDRANTMSAETDADGDTAPDVEVDSGAEQAPPDAEPAASDDLEGDGSNGAGGEEPADDAHYDAPTPLPTGQVSGAGASGEPTPAPTLDPSSHEEREQDEPTPEPQDAAADPGDEATDDDDDGEALRSGDRASDERADFGGEVAIAREPASDDDGNGLRIAQVAFGGLALAAAAVWAGAHFRSRDA